MKLPLRHVLISAALVAGLAACGGDDDDSTATTTAPAADTAGAEATGTIAVTTEADGSVATTVATTAATETTAAEPAVPGGTGGVVRWGTTTQPTSFDPATVGAAANVVFMEPIYDTLIDSNIDGDLLPGLATEWTLADDAMSLELTLRDGVDFQDGTPFNADVVVANFAHMQADDSLLKASLAMITGVDAADDTHVTLTFNRAGGDVAQALTGFAGMMASPASIKAGTNGSAPVGAGPFTINTITDSQATYDYWDGYWDADNIVPSGVQINLMTDDAARLNALRSGQIDVALIRPAQLAEAEAAGLTTYSVPAPQAYGISVNASKPGLNDPDVRRAISMAIDREGIVQGVFDGECTVQAQAYPDTYWAHADIDESEYVKFDPAAAKAIIDAKMPGATLKILTVTVTAYQRLAEIYQEQLAQVGIESTITALDPASYFAAGRAGDYDLWVQLFTPASPDPSGWADANYRLVAGSEEFIDPTIPDLIAEYRASGVQAEQAAAVAKITETALAAGTNQITVCLPGSTWATGTNVSGFSINNPRQTLVK